ncbi:MAG: ribosome maturation factor RimM [Myxococcota bacterium]
MNEEWILLGYAVRAHGVRGELRFSPDTPEAAALLEPGLRLRAVLRGGEEHTLTIGEGLRPIHNAVLFTLEEWVQREDIQRWAGARVYVAAAEVPRDEEPYLFELEGATVVDEAGCEWGTVEGIADNGGQELLVIASGAGERLLPLVDETYVEFDRERRRLVIRPIPGLWDEP